MILCAAMLWSVPVGAFAGTFWAVGPGTVVVVTLDGVVALAVVGAIEARGEEASRPTSATTKETITTTEAQIAAFCIFFTFGFMESASGESRLFGRWSERQNNPTSAR